jgi:hypothetical protein
MGFRVSYIGSRSVGLNVVEYGLNAKPANLTAYSDSLLPFPNLSGLAGYRNDGKAHYDSLQLEASKKAGWVTFDAHYTWASSLNNEGNTDDPANPTKVWAFDQSLRRNLFTITSVWTLPFGKGRQHMNNAPRVVDALLGGWGIQTISYFGSGDHMTPYFYGFDPANDNYNAYIPDVIPGTNGNLPAGQRSQSRWFNAPAYHQDPVTGLFVYDHIGAFKIPGCTDTDPLCLNTAYVAPGRFGNAHVNSLIGPGLNVHHLSIAKTFRLTERVGMTFTSMISDLFNHPNFYDPDTYLNNGYAGGDTSQLIYARADYEPEKAGHRQISFKLRVEF